jgi:predicted peroxiredoxin
MKATGIILTAWVLITSCSQSPVNEPTADTDIASMREGVFIHISESYNDPHRVLMPLKMAAMMAGDKDVIVYMDIHAVELLVKDAKDLSYDGFETCRAYISELREKNVGVYACPTCLKLAGFTPEDLIEGVQTASKDRFFSFTKGRIITLDY